MNAHGYDTKRFPLTPAQGRVLYHLERLFRSTGHGVREHGAYIDAVNAEGMDPEAVATWDDATCVRALGLMEYAARGLGMHLVRPVRTGREDFMPGGRFYKQDVRPHDVAGVT
jgi:hypothetical protein